MLYSFSADRALAVYGYRHPVKQLDMTTLWIADQIPNGSLEKTAHRVTLAKARFKQSVYVDVPSGTVYEIAPDRWIQHGAHVEFKSIPLFDGPVLIADRALVNLGK